MQTSHKKALTIFSLNNNDFPSKEETLESFTISIPADIQNLVEITEKEKQYENTIKNLQSEIEKLMNENRYLNEMNSSLSICSEESMLSIKPQMLLVI